ncbi:MAG: FAD-binding oxidoreductase [Anaerolineae bacterium]|nr:FAD-binding oxidoreductase [Anaerolineae bacterium]
MRRWNGWGDSSTEYPLGDAAAQFLAARLGPGAPPGDVRFEAVAAHVPDARLPIHPAIRTDAAERVRHARGQSFPDWLALRYGRIGAFPDGVAYPESGDDVRALLNFAQDQGVALIPYGGGTSVVGHVNPPRDGPPVLTVDLGRMNRLLHLDAQSGLATFGAGVPGPHLEAQLRAQGFTLGHYPQSFELSTLGGWIVTRSSGQQSMHYGRIERLFVGGRLESPAGTLVLPSFPASAAGPDVREMVLGSEGRMGILTEATVRVVPLPERESFRGVFFPDFASGMAAVREMAQASLPLSMLRLSTARETETTLALAGHTTVIGGMERILAVRGHGGGKCLLILGATGRSVVARAALRQAREIYEAHKGTGLGPAGVVLGQQWSHSRFRTPYLRNTLWQMGYGVDTLETAVPWSGVTGMIAAIESGLERALSAFGERIHVFTHLSHVYPHGSSVYTTVVFRLAPDPDETLARWTALKRAGSEAVVAQGGTISHQHGVGVDHAPYLAAEKGALGMGALREVLRCFDPLGLMNPGKLIAVADTEPTP